MNSRGMELQPTDIIKAEIVGTVSPGDQDTVNDDWEQMEVDLGREGFNDLFSYIRMIYAKEKARKSLLEEFRLHVLTEGLTPKGFVDDILKPYSSAYDIIRTNSYEAMESSKEINELLTWLNRLDVYTLTPLRRSYIMLRLDSFISDGGAVYDPKKLTIEHVLPQTVTDDSEWAELWPDEEERISWVHRIGNILPLNKRRNTSAKNYPFKKKCQAYFSGRDNVSSYALTTQVLNHDKWTPEIVEKRQEDLVEAMKDGWSLHESALPDG